MEEFENALINIFNSTQLPFEAKRYVVIKFMRDVEDVYQREKKKQKEIEMREMDETKTQKTNNT